jgi:hypothetical protein
MRINKLKHLGAMVLSAALSGNVLADLNDGLVAYYPFNGNAQDESGNGNDGTVHGATLTEDRFGNKGSAYSFDGVDDYIEKKNPSNVLNIGSQNWTISVWIKTNNLSQMIISRYECGWDCSPDVGAEALYNLGISNANAYFSVRSDNMYGMKETPIVRDNNNINDGTWHYITGILDRDVLLLKLFIDGKEKNTVSIGKLDSITDGGSPFEIGRIFRQQGSSTEYFKGDIDDIRIYNRALSESEIQQLYATTLETNISPKDSGTITKSPDKSSYSPNEEVTLTATPAKGYKFKQWQGDASGSEATITIKMNGNQNVTAVFEEEEDEKPPIEISSKAIYDSKTKTLSLEGILVPYIDEFTGKETDNKGIFDAQLAEKAKLVFELIPWSINFKDMFDGEDTSGYILYHSKTRSVDIPCFEVTTIAKLGDGIEGDAIYYKDVTMKQRHVNYPIFHVEDMTETDSCN